MERVGDDLAAAAARPRWSWRGWRNRTVASPAFQAWAARFPLTRGLVRGEGERLFDLVAGFVQSQVLAALVELRVLERARDAPIAAAALAASAQMPQARMAVLLRAGASLGLLERVGEGWQTSRTGAALLGVPGLTRMIGHHAVLYRDLADPAAFFRGAGDTELARFWPYVFGAGAAEDPETTAAYSELMAETQGLVAQETLAAVSLKGVAHLMDVGGGTGAFLAAAGRAFPQMRLTLFDLPAVVAGAEARLAQAGLAGRTTVAAGSFRDDPLPRGADAISLVRVLYDHSDATVASLLARAFEALPPGGRIIVSEPMSGGDRPERAGDVYFAVYCLAMGTGRARSPDEVGRMLRAAGFKAVRHCPTRRPFVTSVVTARKP